MSQQQTVLKVQTNIPGSISGQTQFQVLDLYSSIPIAINKSFAELGDIGKKNSDYSIGLMLPGSKVNNAFFENYYNVDAQSYYFNPTQRVSCWVLINDEPFFTGYMKLNKINVKNSQIEYDVTLFSTIGDLYGSIGNNLLKDLNFADEDFQFNHEFSLNNVTNAFNYTNFSISGETPYLYFYPIVHNGYLYTGNTVNFSGGTILERTRLYTSTQPLNSYATLAAAYSAGVQQFRINSPTQGPYDNQLKPALSVWGLLQLMFKTYGYEIVSDFFNTPWMKTLYLYGYFSSDQTKFSWYIYTIETLPIEGVELFFLLDGTNLYVVVCKLGTGIPVYCSEDINYSIDVYDDFGYVQTIDGTVPYGTSGRTYSDIYGTYVEGSSSQVPNASTLKYLPRAVGESVNFVDGDYVDFSLVIDQNIKQIDLLSSIAKKFNLILVPEPDGSNMIRIEPYDYFIGKGTVHNWSDKISFDKGFTVEPALNYIESTLILSDADDNDEGNKQFKNNNNRTYGINYYYGPTSFKSSEKKIDTIFGPELIRKWDTSGTGPNGNISLPLGINYVGSSSEEVSASSVVNWIYKGVKTKPKLMWWLGCFNPFLDIVGENYDATNFYKTYQVYVSNSSGSTYNQFDRIPVISHTMPMGLSDVDKINNDSQCLLFNSERPADTNVGVQIFNTYTENDAYNSFYEGRVSNIYDPNTRVFSGYFNLSYSDLKNLRPEDLIKINEQYFVVSKIEGFNLTNRELTKVELIQFNNQVNNYTTRYFMYEYCDGLNDCIFKFKTDFTNPNMLDSNYGWSIFYDHSVGSLTGQTSGFTSSFKYVQGTSSEVYCPYTMYEVDEATYNSTGVDWTYDSLHNHIYNTQYGPFQYNMPTFWLNSASNRQGTNLFNNCSEFYSTATTWGITTGSSIYFGQCSYTTPTPTPTPTSTITPTIGTPTPTYTITPTITPTYTITPTITPTETITPTLTPTQTITPTSAGTATLDWSFTESGGASGTMDLYVNASVIESRTSTSSGTYTVNVGDTINVQVFCDTCSEPNNFSNAYSVSSKPILADAACGNSTSCSILTAVYTVVSGDIGTTITLDTFAACESGCL